MAGLVHTSPTDATLPDPFLEDGRIGGDGPGMIGEIQDALQSAGEFRSSIAAAAERMASAWRPYEGLVQRLDQVRAQRMRTEPLEALVGTEQGDEVEVFCDIAKAIIGFQCPRLGFYVRDLLIVALLCMGIKLAGLA